MGEQKDFKILTIQGTDYQTLFTTKFANRTPWEKENPKKVKNQIPGTVLEIYVREGDFIAEGEDLIDIEAMKMINKITAPFSGKIIRLFVHPGQILPKGTAMVEYE